MRPVSLPRLSFAAGLALVTLLGALAAPSPAWFAPLAAIAALALVPAAPPRSQEPLSPFAGHPAESFRWLGPARRNLCHLQAASTALTTGLLHAALGAALGLAFLLGVMAL